MARVLIAEDEMTVREFLAEALDLSGHEVVAAPDGDIAANLLDKSSFDVLLTDLNMPGRSGMDLLKKVRKEQPHVQVVVLTANTSISSAVEAMKLGALEYLQKPMTNPSELELVVNRAVERRRLLRLEEHVSREQSGTQTTLTWGAPAMKPVLNAMEKVAKTHAAVLLLGESGTGKEVSANAIHGWSQRASKPFVAVNCAALSETLIESELFGHERGAFTGAHSQHLGRIELADEGTFFLDEIGDLKLDLQAKLLRVIETKCFERVGGHRTIKVDVRWIAATHHDLIRRVEEGTFREDLYHRLAVFPIELPPLRERREDIIPLAKLLVQSIGRELGRKGMTLSEEAHVGLREARWSGNVRELRNTLERAIILADGVLIKGEHLAGRRRGVKKSAPAGLAGRKLAEIEREAIEETLRSLDGNRRKAAESLGIGLRTLYDKLKKHNLSEP